jgi:hypothetical protein
MWIPRWIELATRDIVSHIGAIRKSIEEQAITSSDEKSSAREEERDTTGALRAIAHNIKTGNDSATTAHVQDQIQQRELIRAQWSTVKWTAGACIAAAVYALIAAYQGCQMKIATDAAAKSANTAACAPKENRRQFDITTARTKDEFDQTLKEMQGQSKAAQTSADVARTAMAIQLQEDRAVVSIGDQNGVLADFVSDPSSKDSSIVIYFHNSGHFRSKFIWGLTIDRVIPTLDGRTPKGIVTVARMPQQARIERHRMPNGVIGEDFQTQLIPGEGRYTALLATVPYQAMQEIASPKYGFRILGEYEYCDGLGGDIRKSFVLEYRSSGPPSKANFSLPQTLDVNPPVVPSHGASELSPCEDLTKGSQSKGK